MTFALVVTFCVSLAGQPLTCDILAQRPQPFASRQACYDAGIAFAERTMREWPNSYVHFDCLKA